MIDDVVLGEILDLVCKTLPFDWDRIVLYMEYGKGSYSFKYYYSDKDNKFIQDFDINGIKEDDIINTYMGINKLLVPKLLDISKEDMWDNCTITFNSEHKFTIDYDYNSYDDRYEFREIWKYKYLDIMPKQENEIAYNAVQNYIKESNK